ncbi:MAG: TetM/TetW/TetO/TetS family tetracycline resistance ribosomal protection protein [Anaerobutyricum hallii]|uniref:TetM/TetW/TetO/TetS family tetracycline resistance ribosomal protection protein n=1 Tax=Anaerobutyricum hallii TaxID=39488 RepID=UPI002431552C|nr:TetM/TetW/TetO/TetS family tetracycline resistance ribosomal protection protein [Anaerobutyricum hallii]MDD6587234.1 TetM/TetW/TetO/TetS family tetracycline resistance ribosomal protection protein [Anaerobutyricum hallii]
MSLFFLLKRGEIVENIVMGILAHVDAGKTTLSEGMLYLSGTVRKLGRVDHKDAFLDTYSLERDRGITIFSKQAVFSLGNRRINLLDTPGHVDFSAEMERTLQVLDYAVLVISGADGVQGHTETLWKLLKLYEIPTFIFINKMDQPGTDRESLLTELKERLDEGCIVFGKGKNVESLEEIAMTDEAVLDYFMEHETVRNEDICRLIRERKIFPCYFGSALKLDGVQELLAGFEEYMKPFDGKKEFGARVFKISRDDKGERLTFLKVTGGKLVVKMPINKEEKINQIRIYSGAKYEAVNEVEAGGVCAVTGLSSSYIGQGLGVEKGTAAPFLEPVLTYQMILPEGADTTKVLRELKQLEEEEPLLNIVWNPALEEIHVQLMGEVQTEILKTMIAERFHLDVEFGTGKIVYKETIKSPVVGVGHYEPLRHYAEVHLKMEPLEAGSGLVFDTDCSEDVLDRNWQRLILTHLQEREHPGVLTGAPITDMKITIVAGRAHLKHTEGGDFRQATYRAVRQGLKSAESVLLEPWYSFVLEVPSEQVGRAMSDIGQMNGSFEGPEAENKQGMVRLTGTAPASEMRDYQREVWAYTKGRGRITLTLKGYEPCHNAEEVIEEIGYDSERDVDNPTGSVFCAHGAGFLVKWDEVPEYMHIKEDFLAEKPGIEQDEMMAVQMGNHCNYSGGYSSSYDDDPELLTIMEREFGSKQEERDRYSSYRKQTVSTPVRHTTVIKENEPKKEYLLVDGYNIIFAWEELNELAKASIDAARNKLMDILSNYQGFSGCTLILVFDAYKVKGNQGEVQKYHNIYVVYTKEAETADQYIEKTTHEIGRKYKVTVATSDALEQVIVMGQGAYRISARDFYEEVERTEKQIQEINERERGEKRNYLLDYAREEDAREMEKVRLGKTTEK